MNDSPYEAAQDVHWRYEVPSRTDSKMLVLTIGGMCVVGSWYGRLGEHFIAWSPMPKRDHVLESVLGVDCAWAQPARVKK